MLNVKGEVLLFVNENKDTKNKWFSTTISDKKSDGTYDNLSVVVRFTGDLKEKASKLSTEYRYKVDIVEAFLSHFNKKVELVVREATIKEKTKNEVKKESNKKPKINDDDLPF